MAATSFLPLRDLCTTMQFQAGEAIQADGLSADRWFVVLSGEVSMHCLPEEPWERSHVLGAGDSFGERALLEARRLPAARARAATECLTLRRHDFYGLLRDNTGEEEQTYRVRPPAKKSYPWVAQREAADCGVAALAMVLRYYRPSASTEMLGQHLRLDSRGASLLQLQRAAARIGFVARAVRIGPAQLAEATLPAIAHLADGHYVVVYCVYKTEMILGDPAQGVVNVPASGFRQSWSGHLLLLTPALEQRR